MPGFDLLVVASCIALVAVGVIFIYYLTTLSQRNDATETRTKRRMEDVAYYLSKLEEHIDDAEGQLHKKIDSQELEARINLSIYDNLMTKALPPKIVPRRTREEKAENEN